MRHATVNAIRTCLGLDSVGKMGGFPSYARACDWSLDAGDGATDVTHRAFSASEAALMLGVNPALAAMARKADPPTCPRCSHFIDLALSIRAEEAQTQINAEIDAERRMTA